MKSDNPEIDDFPPGTVVKTPTGRVGVVIKARGSESKFDHFERIAVKLSSVRDTVVLQPHLLEKIASPDEMPMVLTTNLPWPPKELNPNARVHWAKLAKVKKSYRQHCAWQAVRDGLKRQSPECAPAVHLTFCPPNKRRRDWDNLLASMKAGLDGLSDVLGIDDSRFRISFELDYSQLTATVQVKVTL